MAFSGFKLIINDQEHGDIDITPYIPQPFTIDKKLDESLDLISTSARNTPIDFAIRPFTQATISYFDGSDKSSIWYVAEDTLERNIQTNTYNHTISLIEETKILERYILPTRMFSQPLNLAFQEPTSPIITLWQTDIPSPVKYYFGDYIDIYNNEYWIPLLIRVDNDTYRFTPYSAINYLTDLGKNEFSVATMTITYTLQSGETQTNSVTWNLTTDTPTLPTYTPQVQNIPSMHIDYSIKFLQEGLTGEFRFDVQFIYAQLPSMYTIYDVCQRLLNSAECLLESETPKFSIGNANTDLQYLQGYNSNNYISIAELQDKISPEFTFNRNTLWEAFSIIGGYLNSIPKLINNKIFFQKTENNSYTSQLSTNEYQQYLIADSNSYSNEQYCSTLDTYVDNLIDIENSLESSITEPFEYGYKTLRNESGVVQVTTDGSSFIKTTYPIAKIISVECGYLPNGTYVGDITNYVVEEAQYNAYSAFSDEQPNKATLIKYTYGEPNITGLTFKAEEAWANAFGLDLFNNYAIINIISRVTGQPINIIQQAFTNIYDMRFLQFRVKYIPIFSGRIRQSKQTIADNVNRSLITYNPNTNQVNGTYYGENLKGIVSRLGNVEVVKSYAMPISAFNGWLSEVGVYWETMPNYVVAETITSIYNDIVRIDVHLSKNFNRYNQFVGINTHLRQYEVSEKQIVEREDVYEEYLVVSYDSDTTQLPFVDYQIIEGAYKNYTMIGAEQYGMSRFISSFDSGYIPQPQIDSVLVQTYDTAGNEIIVGNQEYGVILPAISVGFGNSIYLKFKFEDNYSAGDYVTPTVVDNVLFDQQNYVPYSDYFGNIEYMKLSFISSINSVITGFDNAYNYGNKIPIFDTNYIDSYYPIVTTGDNHRILLQKTTNEQISFVYQLNFIADEQYNLVIGSGLSKTNNITSTSTNNYKLFILNRKLSGLDLFIDTSSLTPVDNIGFSSSDTEVDYFGSGDNLEWYAKITKTFTANADGLSWAIIDTNTNYFILGRNINISIGDTITMPNFYPVRKLKFKQS